jgi:hypothetical protein
VWKSFAAEMVDRAVDLVLAVLMPVAKLSDRPQFEEIAAQREGQDVLRAGVLHAVSVT